MSKETTMNIICDIGHPAHVNFFKSALIRLSEEGHTVTIIGLNRGRLQDIIRREFRDFRIRFVGKHRGGKLSIVFEANVAKFLHLLYILRNEKCDIGISVGSITLGLALKFYGKPNIQFDDDPERKLNVFLEKLTSTELYFPPVTSPNGKIRIMNSLKEWAYLSPEYFSPDKQVLKEYNLSPYRYLFVREISTKSFNYNRQHPFAVATFAHKLPSRFKVVFSLEDKSALSQYPPDWILLEEPVRDIHSLIYYSKVAISSGDSIAREGALLGVPSIYCGQRKMKANQVLCKKGLLFVKAPDDVPECVGKIIAGEIRVDDQEKFRHKLTHDWEDVTGSIIRKMRYYAK